MLVKKKIVYYVNMFLFGGVETSMLEYLRALDQGRFEVTLVIGIYMYELEVLLPEIPAHIHVVYVLRGQFFSRNYYLKRLGKLCLMRKAIEACVAPVRKIYLKNKIAQLLTGYDTVVDYALSLTKYNLTLSVRKIGYFHYSLKEYYLTDASRIAAFRSVLSSYAKIIILNQHMYAEALEVFPELSSKFMLMYNQFDFTRIHNLAMQASDAKVADEYIVSVGRLEENQKDFTSLIKAYKILREKYFRTEKLIIIGSGKDSNNLQGLIDDLGLSTYVVLAGHKINPFPWLSNSKLFAFSSKFEGLAMVLVEAMVLQKAVISTDCPNGPREVLMDGDCGLLVKVGDCDSLALGMHNLLNDNELYQHCVDNANQHLGRFDITRNISQLEKVLIN